MKIKTLLFFVVSVLCSGYSFATDSNVTEGGDAYIKECAFCHQGFNTGAIMLRKRLGEERAYLDSREDLTTAYIKHVVRNGIGSMPAISRVEVTESQLATISAYLTRNNNN